MTVFFQHVGEKGGRRDFPKTIGTAKNGLVHFQFDDIRKYLNHLSQHEQDELSAHTKRYVPEGFQIWGIPSGAKSVLRTLTSGDYLLLLVTIGPSGTFAYGGRVVSAPTQECFDLSLHLWGEQRFPLIVFLKGVLINYRWETFRDNLRYAQNWNPAGNTYSITESRLLKSTYENEDDLIMDVLGTDLPLVSSDITTDSYFYDPSEVIFEAEEGRRALRSHLQRERSSALIRSFKRSLTHYNCSVCGFDFEQAYGQIGRGFIEAHHTKPISSLQDAEIVSVKDLIPVCSNCHRMLHSRIPLLDVASLKECLATSYAKRSDGLP